MLDDELDRRWVVAEAEARLFGTHAAVHVGRFEVRGRLGAGGLGIVYAAYDPELDREVAIKVLRDHDAGVQREARAMAKLAHPNVVPVYEVGVHDGRVFLAMERVAGKTLRTWLHDAKPGWAEIVRVFVGAGRGLAAAHAAGTIHRDFKPENVLVGDDGRARVADFGLAITGEDHGDYAGTAAYMAPEQRRQKEGSNRSASISFAVDQYAFGVAIWEALYGARPDTKPQLVTDSPVPRRIGLALQRALALSASARWPSMTELLDVIERPPQRKVLRTIAWAILAIVIAAVLVAAVTQFWMFRDWMNEARR
ncbi:MAG: serine/threonine protein kinase [Myxococcota bacterium]|nr:serine/threonine protein kinase [Myxococcota bacterium]